MASPMSKVFDIVHYNKLGKYVNNFGHYKISIGWFSIRTIRTLHAKDYHQWTSK